jgi:phenylacetate-CoA ligase
LSLETLYQRAPSWAQHLFLNAYGAGIAWHRYGRAYRRALQECLERDDWPADRMRRYQDDRIRAVIRTAYAATAHYREIMDGLGIRPEGIRSVSDLRQLPILEKGTVRDEGARLMSSPRPRPGWVHGHTSGTTGTPMGLWYDRATCVITNAVDRRQKIWGGMGRADWIGMFLGRVVVPVKSGAPYWRANHVQRQVWFSSFHMSDAALPSYVEEIRRKRLQYIEGYPSTLFILAQHLLERGQKVPMKGVFSSSETLHRIQREAITEAFDCDLFDFYGHAERTIFAAECEAHSGRHLAEDFGFVEVVNAQGQQVAPGETGYLVGTSLHNQAMPLIRYRTGDLSSIQEEPCPCGRSARRIADVTTKAEDIVVTPDCRLISPSILTHPFKPFEGVLKSQIVQEQLDFVRVRLVLAESFSTTDRERLIAGIQARLGGDVRIAVEEVEAIPPEPSGKFRWVVSRVDHSRLFNWAKEE